MAFVGKNNVAGVLESCNKGKISVRKDLYPPINTNKTGLGGLAADEVNLSAFIGVNPCARSHKSVFLN